MKTIPEFDQSKPVSIRPIHSKVLIKPFKNPDLTPGGIMVPEIYRQFCGMARVLAVGPGTKKVSTDDVKAGDVIAISPFSGSELRVDGEDCRLVEMVEILGVYKESHEGS